MTDFIVAFKKPVQSNVFLKPIGEGNIWNQADKEPLAIPMNITRLLYYVKLESISLSCAESKS